MATLSEILESRTDRRRLSLMGMAVVAGGFLAACGDEDEEAEEVVEEEEDAVEEVEEGGEDALGTVEGEGEELTDEESE
jgi:hypothetical protein